MVFSGLSLVALTWGILLGHIPIDGPTIAVLVIFALLTSIFYSAHKEFIKFRTQMELVRTAGLETARKIGKEFDLNNKEE